MKRVKSWVVKLSHTRIGRALIGWGMGHMNFALPVERLYETATLVAFRHPTPAYPFHVVILPKREIPSLMGLSAADAGFSADLFTTVQALVREFNLEAAGYRLIANGGAYQEFPVLHFHLVSGQAFK